MSKSRVHGSATADGPLCLEKVWLVSECALHGGRPCFGPETGLRGSIVTSPKGSSALHQARLTPSLTLTHRLVMLTHSRTPWVGAKTRKDSGMY
jgi:hypothetical protein